MAVTNGGVSKGVTSAVTDVDQPLLSVSQVTARGGKVVVEKGGIYIQYAGDKQRIGWEQRYGLFTLKMWVPRGEAKSPFRRQAQNP